MARRRPPATTSASVDVDAALGELSAEALRELIRDLLPEIDEHARARVLDSIVRRATRGDSGRAPDRPSSDAIAKVVKFAESTRRDGYAEPQEVDAALRESVNAFLAKDYRSACELLGALLPLLAEGDIDLGQDELVDEVLDVDLAECATAYVVARYMSAEPSQRAAVVRAAIGEVDGVGLFWEPLREMERVAVEPLSGFDEFLPHWRSLIEAPREQRDRDWDRDEDRWLREVVGRMQGAGGLAKLAQMTGRAEDFRTWCDLLVAAKDWKAALAAYRKAADTVTDDAYSRGEFLDGIALAARELGRKDFPAQLERAWREAPTLLRLRRWFGSASTKTLLRKRATQALAARPRKAARQLALIHVVLGDPASAAQLLARAPGLGWSQTEHPGHLLLPIFRWLLGGTEPPAPDRLDAMSAHGLDVDEMDWMVGDEDGPRLDAPEINDILRLAGTAQSVTDKTREAILRGMRKAAEKRVAGVTEHKRRRYYAHAAELVATCVALDPTPKTATWATGIRDAYRRYPALQREFANLLPA